LRKDLTKKGYEFICPTAPIKTLPVNASSPTEREKLEEAERSEEEYPYWGWCTMDEDKEEMRGLEKSVEFLRNILETQVRRHCFEIDIGTFCGDIRIFSRCGHGGFYCIASRKKGYTENVSAD